MRLSLEPVAFSPGAAAVHKQTAKFSLEHTTIYQCCRCKCAVNKLSVLSASFAKSLLSSSSAVSLEKLSSPKGFQLGWLLGAVRAAWASPSPGWYTLCWDEQGEPEGVVLADLQYTEV